MPFDDLSRKSFHGYPSAESQKDLSLLLRCREEVCSFDRCNIGRALCTGHFRFVTAGDDSIFPQDETGTEQLTKRVLLFTGDCFLGMEHKTAVPDKLLADLFCSNTADDRVSEYILSKCLSPEERDQEELDYKRMCAVWDELAGSDKRAESDKRAKSDELVGFIGKNLINSSRATSYANDYNKIPYSMAEIKLSEYPQVLIDARYQNILNRLAPYVAEKCGEKLYYVNNCKSVFYARTERSRRIPVSFHRKRSATKKRWIAVFRKCSRLKRPPRNR